MKALKGVLLVVMLLCFGMMLAGCNEGHARSNTMTGDSRTETDIVGWEQGLSGFPHPVVLHP